MKNWLLAAILAVSMVPASGCVGGLGGFSVEAPSWQAGYSFAFQEEGTYNVQTYVDGKSRSEKGPYGPIDKVMEVLNTTLTAEDDPVYLTAMRRQQAPRQAEAASDESHEGADGEQPPVPAIEFQQRADIDFVAFRQRDLQEVQTGFFVKYNCGNEGCGPSDSRLEFAPPPNWTFLKFPLESGKSWSAVVVDDSDEIAKLDTPEEDQVKIRAEVQGRRTVDTGVGPTKAVRVDFTIAPVSTDAIRRAAEKDVEEEGGKLEAFEFEAQRRVSIYYSEEYQTFVRVEYANTVHVLVRGESEDGEKFDFAQDVETRGKQVLKGARLVARAERDLDYLGALWSGQVQIQDPTGTAVEAADYVLELAASKLVVNAAEPEPVTFTGAVRGLDALPEGHAAQWSIADAYGGQVAAGEGLSFTHTFEEPGEYSVEIVAHDANGNVTAGDGVVLAANYEKTIPLKCAPVALEPTLRGCASVPVPVRPGIRSLLVEATTTGLSNLPGISAAQLRLQGIESNKRYTDSSPSQNKYSIELEDFGGVPVSRQDWSLQLYQMRAVLQDVTYHINLQYASTPGPVEESASSGFFETWTSRGAPEGLRGLGL